MLLTGYHSVKNNNEGEVVGECCSRHSDCIQKASDYRHFPVTVGLQERAVEQAEHHAECKIHVDYYRGFSRGEIEFGEVILEYQSEHLYYRYSRQLRNNNPWIIFLSRFSFSGTNFDLFSLTTGDAYIVIIIILVCYDLNPLAACASRLCDVFFIK